VVAATFVEAWAVRREAPGVSLLRAGPGLRRLREPPRAAVVLSIGLAGGLSAAATPGTVVIPSEVAYRERRARCDPAWSEALASAAVRLGYPLLREPMLTSGDMVTGVDRDRWAARGFAAVDMETGRAAEQALRVAAARVVLDAPGRDLSPRWQHPVMAMLDPRCWRDALWLARHAPRFARRAARVLASALAEGNVDAEV
jgi:hypothetical protein